MYMCVHLGLMTCILMPLLVVLVVIFLPMPLILHFTSPEMQAFEYISVQQSAVPNSQESLTKGSLHIAS